MSRDTRRTQDALAHGGHMTVITQDGFTWWTTILIEGVCEVIGKGKTPKRSIRDALDLLEGRKEVGDGTPAS